MFVSSSSLTILSRFSTVTVSLDSLARISKKAHTFVSVISSYESAPSINPSRIDDSKKSTSTQNVMSTGLIDSPSSVFADSCRARDVSSFQNRSYFQRNVRIDPASISSRRGWSTLTMNGATCAFDVDALFCDAGESGSVIILLFARRTHKNRNNVNKSE